MAPRTADVLPKLESHAARTLFSSDPRPGIVLLESGPGLGKTYAVQRLYDSLAGRLDDYWRPGLAEASVPEDERGLVRSRKRIMDESLCDTRVAPRWLWIGIPCAAMGEESRFRDPYGGLLLPQLEFHMLHMRRRYERGDEVLGGLRESALGFAELIPGVGTIRSAQTIGRGVTRVARALGAKAHTSDDDLALRIDRCVDVFDRIVERDRAGIGAIIVLDDAHEASDSTLDLVGRLLVGDGVGGGARRVLVVATAWPGSQAPALRKFRDWLGSMSGLGVACDVLDEGAGYFSDFSLEQAETMARDRMPELDAASARGLIAHGAGDGAINPYLLMTYLTRFRLDHRPGTACCDAGWIEDLPRCPADIAARRISGLSPEARHLLALASRIGLSHPSVAAAWVLSDVDRSASPSPAEHPAAAAAVAQGLLEASQWATLGKRPPDSPERQLFRFHRFTHDFDFHQAQVLSERMTWVEPKAREAVDLWLRAVLDYSAQDLEHGDPVISDEVLLDAIGPLARLYLGGTDPVRSDESLASFCRSVVAEDGAASGPETGSASAPGDPLRGDAALATLWREVRRASDDPGDVDPTVLVDLAERFAPRSRLAVSSALIALEASGEEALSERAQALLRTNSAATEAAVHLSRLLIETGRPEEVVPLLQDKLDSPQARVFQAFGQVVRGDLEAAVETIAPDAVSGHTHLKVARLLRENGRSDLAETILEAAPESAVASMALAKSRRQVGDRAGARAALSDAAGNPNAAVMLAHLLAEDGEVEAATGLLGGFVGNSYATVALAKIHRSAGHPDLAVECLTGSSLSSEGLHLLLDIHLKRGDLDVAVGAYEEHGPDLTVALRLAGVLAGVGRLESALSILGSVGEYGTAAVHMADLLLRSGDEDRAMAVLEDHGDAGAVAVKIAEILGERKDTRGAIRALERVGDDPIAKVRLAELFEATGRGARAVETLRGATRTLDVALKLADLLAARGDRAGALEALAGLDLNEAARIKMSDILTRTGDPDAAIGLLAPARKNPLVAVRLAELLRQADRSVEAIDLLRSVAPHSGVVVKLSELYLEAEDPDAARAVLEKLPQDSNAAVKLAEIHLDAGDGEAAMATLARVEGDANTSVRHAQLLRDRGRIDEAIATLSPLTENETVALELAKLLLAEERGREASEAVAPHMNYNLTALLLVVSSAEHGALRDRAERRLAELIDDHVSRQSVFEKICGLCFNADDVLAYLPAHSRSLNQFVKHLYARAERDWHAAGLYAHVHKLAGNYPVGSAWRVCRRHAERHGFCASTLAHLVTSADRVDEVADLLRIRIEAGDYYPCVSLAHLGIAFDRADLRREALGRLRRYDEFSEYGLELYQTLLEEQGEHALFRMVRKEPTPRGVRRMWRRLH